MQAAEIAPTLIDEFNLTLYDMTGLCTIMDDVVIIHYWFGLYTHQLTDQ